MRGKEIKEVKMNHTKGKIQAVDSNCRTALNSVEFPHKHIAMVNIAQNKEYTITLEEHMANVERFVSLWNAAEDLHLSNDSIVGGLIQTMFEFFKDMTRGDVTKIRTTQAYSELVPGLTIPVPVKKLESRIDFLESRCYILEFDKTYADEKIDGLLNLVQADGKQLERLNNITSELYQLLYEIQAIDGWDGAISKKIEAKFKELYAQREE